MGLKSTDELQGLEGTMFNWKGTGIRTRDFRGGTRHWSISDAGSGDTGLMPAGVCVLFYFSLGR
jgi:hypothetical protein